MKIPSQSELKKVYGESQKSAERFQSLASGFAQKYGREKAEFFSAPGRTEIIGNHTDHNGGMILAASIDMDTVGAAYPNDSHMIHITSEGYKKEIVIDLNALDAIPKKQGTEALVAGMVEATRTFGFQVLGFDAYISTNVISAAGVSSSASFEMLICSIINHFFNDDSMSYVDYAKIGQYAENVYWKKASGLMDQMACAVGGTILLDFSDSKQISYQKMDFSFQSIGYQLVIVNTGKGHADLSSEYSEIPLEMKEVASALGVNLLCETNMESLLSHLQEMKNDRAILRAMHFFEENRRVKKAAELIEQDNKKEFLDLLQESGTSSWEWLQNCYSLQNYKEQRVPLILALTKLFLKDIQDGICRVHGGGFAGVIMCIVPENKSESYINYISKYVGLENVYPMDIRAAGAVHLALDM